MTNVIPFPTQTKLAGVSSIQGFSAIDVVKDGQAMQLAIHGRVINSFEDALEAKIELAHWRAEGYNHSGDPAAAALETSYADGLIWALHRYREWNL